MKNDDIQERWKNCIKETCSTYKLVYDNMEVIKRIASEVSRVAIELALDFSKCLNKFLVSMSNVLNGNKKRIIKLSTNYTQHVYKLKRGVIR